MPRDFKVYLEDILEAARKIRLYTAGLSFEAFCDDSKTTDAVIRNLEIIGEAIKQIPEPIRERRPPTLESTSRWSGTSSPLWKRAPLDFWTSGPALEGQASTAQPTQPAAVTRIDSLWDPLVENRPGSFEGQGTCGLRP